MIKRLLFLAAVMAALCSCGSVPEESIRPTIDLNRVLTASGSFRAPSWS